MALRGNSVPGPQDLDPDYPEAEFRVGDYWYVVEVGPPLVPVALVRALNSPLATVALFIIGIPLFWLAFRVDDRVKLSVSRRGDRRPFFRLVHVEYFADMESAERRQFEIRKSWVFGEKETDQPLTFADSLSAYRIARRVVPRAR